MRTSDKKHLGNTQSNSSGVSNSSFSDYKEPIEEEKQPVPKVSKYAEIIQQDSGELTPFDRNVRAYHEIGYEKTKAVPNKPQKSKKQADELEVQEEGNTGGKKPKKGLIIGLIAGVAALAIAAVVVFVFIKPFNKPVEPSESSTKQQAESSESVDFEADITEIENMVLALYTDETKSAIETEGKASQIIDIRSKLADFEIKAMGKTTDYDDRVKAIKQDLNDVDTYLNVSKEVKSLEEVEIDLADIALEGRLESIKAMLGNISNNNLTDPIYEKVNAILNAQESYNSLKALLTQEDIDFDTFDFSGTEKKISEIPYEKNAQELTLLFEILKAKKDVYDASKALEDAKKSTEESTTAESTEQTETSEGGETGETAETTTAVPTTPEEILRLQEELDKANMRLKELENQLNQEKVEETLEVDPENNTENGTESESSEGNSAEESVPENSENGTSDTSTEGEQIESTDSSTGSTIQE